MRGHLFSAIVLLAAGRLDDDPAEPIRSAPAPELLRPSSTTALASPAALRAPLPPPKKPSPPGLLHRSLAEYERWSRYPPDSRPAAEQVDEMSPRAVVSRVRLLEPVAYLRFLGDLEPGSRQVRLSAFGRILREANADGAFVLRGLDAWRLAETGREVVPRWPAEYWTRPYALNDFSDAAWDSPAKARRLAALRKLMDGE